MNKIGPYTIIRLIGEGGMGVVYEALHETIARRVAIKLLSHEYAHNHEVIHRFFNEARATNLIDHPSLVQVSDLGQLEDGRAYIVMELLKGESLVRRLRQHPMPVVQTLRLAWQIAEALSAAHRAGIIHRDLKPDNIMVVPDPVAPGGERAKILDFGIAKLAQGGPVKTALNLLMGTPRYMSPEQCRGASEVDAKTDVYSLGVMLYEMLAGRLPFEAEGSGDFLIMHVMQEPPPLSLVAPELPVAVAEFVHRLMSKDRTQRPDMLAAARELAALGASVEGTAPMLASARRASELVHATLAVSDLAAVSTRSHAASQLQSPRSTSRLQLGGLLLFLVMAAGLLSWRGRFWKPKPTVEQQAAVPLRAPEPTPKTSAVLDRPAVPRTTAEPSISPPKSAPVQLRGPSDQAPASPPGVTPPDTETLPSPRTTPGPVANPPKVEPPVLRNRSESSPSDGSRVAPKPVRLRHAIPVTPPLDNHRTVPKSNPKINGIYIVD